MAFDLQSGYGLGAGADELQAQLKDLFTRALAKQQMAQNQQRLDQEAKRQATEDAIRRESMQSLVDSRNFAQQQAATKAADAAKASDLAGTQASLRAGIQASQNLAGTDNPTGALGTRNALRMVLTSTGAKPNEVPQEPPAEKPKEPKLYAVETPGPNGQPIHRLATQDEMLKGVPGYKAPSSMNNIGGGNGALTDEGVDYAATQYRVTGTMPPMGMGNAQARAAIINKAAAQAKVLGQTPAASIQRQAAYKSDGAALSRMRTMSSAAESFETKALAQADIVDNLSAQVPRTNIPLLNRALLAGQRDIAGDPATAQFYNAIQTFSTEYAKIMEGSTGSVAASTESARRVAERLVSAAQSPKQLKATVDLMRKEMRLTIGGYDATIDHITNRMGGTAPGPASGPAPGPTPPTNETPEQRLARLLKGG